MSDVPIDPIGAARRLDTILGRADLPYTNTDEDGDTLLIASGLIEMHKGNRVASMRVPTGEDAAAFARAVLAAAGDTGCRVVHEADLIGADNAVRAMRQRAAYLVEYSPDTSRGDLVEAIRALPLLPEGDTTEDTGPPPCAAMSPAPGAPGLPYGCEGTAGHEGDHYALRGSVKWGDTEPAVVHVATPEGITPCGHGTRDVTTAALIAEVTCVGCLQALALEKGGQVVEMRNERDRLRTAWESARRGRAQARETAGMERFFAGVAEADVTRLRKELRAESARVSAARDERDQALTAARSTRDRIAEWLEEVGSAWEGAHVRAMTLLPASSDQTGDALPAEDLAEPDDEVPALAELRALVERLALDQAETTKAVTQRLATVEDRLGITDEEPPADGILPSVRELRRMHEEEKANTPEAPTRYRDRDGDTWERVDPFLYALVYGEGYCEGIFARPLWYVRDNYGPLTPVTATSEPSGPCETCGRAPEEQEHGPDGQCRHTPATRLGRPTT